MTTTPQSALLSEAAKLADELDHEASKRACNVAMMPASLPVDAAKELRRLDALVAHLTADRDDTANELALRTKHNLALTNERDQLLAKLQATQAEPVQEGELTALPHDGWPARFRCDSCDGNGEIGELISMGYFQPPERQTCPDCGGRGWSDEGPAFNADHMRDYARAALSARKPLTPLTPAHMEKGRDQLFSINNPFCPCDSKTFSKVAEWVERHHGIGLEVKP